MTDAERFTGQFIKILIEEGYDTCQIAEFAEAHPHFFPGISDRPVTESSIYNALARGDAEVKAA